MGRNGADEKHLTVAVRGYSDQNHVSFDPQSRNSFMAATRILAPLFFICVSVAGAQAPTVSGAFISTLGNDTIQVERYTRTGDKLEGDILRKSPRVQVVHYVADLATGKIKGISVTTRPYGTDPTSPAAFSLVTLFSDSSASMEVLRAGRPDSANSGVRKYQGRAIPLVPGLPSSAALYEEALSLYPVAARDSVVVNLVAPGLAENPNLKLVRRSRDTIQFVSSAFVPGGWTEVAVVDANGRLMSLDASGTTVKAVSRRATNLDFDAIAKAWGAYEAAHGPAGSMSPRDTLRATVGAANVEIQYSRPLKRGRVIFGNVVPWNQVWRTGANAATQLTTSADLMIGNTALPAGKYTLWSLPTPTGAKLIINSQTGQWGTEYDMSKDFARVDLTQAMLTKPVDEFTFALVPNGNAGVLKFSWDDREYSVPIRVK